MSPIRVERRENAILSANVSVRDLVFTSGFLLITKCSPDAAEIALPPKKNRAESGRCVVS